jgi:hypothetical protein
LEDTIVVYSFKSDDSFLKKLAVGAAGTNATIDRLRQMGFNPIELERGSTGFKIWKRIKIKRVRVPDILCLNTGLRFESRGKTKPEISMSHSLNDPNRAWDAGMRDDDFVSIVVVEQNDDSPVDLKIVSPVHFVSVKDMRDAFVSEQVSITKPKGVEEGSEIRVVWPSALANQKSIVTEVEAGKISLTPLPIGRRQTILLSRGKGKILLNPQVKDGDAVEMNQIVASVVPIHMRLTCPASVDETYFIDKLASVKLSERYAAAKAMRHRGYTLAKPVLEARVNDTDEDIYVQLEAAAALAAYDDTIGWEFMENKLHSSVLTISLETQLETVIVASEIPKERSERLIIEVLKDPSRDVELRAGAAWALGQFASNKSASALVDTFNSSSLEIEIEAARALLRIAEPQVSHLVNLLKTGDPSKRDGISWVLARTGKFNPASIVAADDDNLRRWISYIVGYGKENFVQAEIESICKADPQIYFAASVLWQIVASWINELKEY